jgi:hypothetical protein
MQRFELIVIAHASDEIEEHHNSSRGFCIYP